MDWWFFENNILPCLSIGFIGFVAWMILSFALSKAMGDNFGVSSGDTNADSSSSNTDYSRDTPFSDRRWDERWKRKEIVQNERRYSNSDSDIRERYESQWGRSDMDTAFKDADKDTSFIGWLLK